MSLRMLLLTLWYSGSSLEHLALQEWCRRPLALPWWGSAPITVRGPWRSEVVL